MYLNFSNILEETELLYTKIINNNIFINHRKTHKIIVTAIKIISR
jgi:hypothetical protein